MRLEFVLANLQQGSHCEVNWLITSVAGERLPTINFAHADLPEAINAQNSMAAVRAALLWLAERINALVQPNIRIS